MEEPSSVQPPPVDTPSITVPSPVPKKSLKPLIPLLILVGFLPLGVGAVMLRQSMSGQAAFFTRPCSTKIASVRIHPGQASTTVNGLPIYLSALAYDNKGLPIWKGVVYEWGISSSNSIGNLVPDNQTAVFTPANPGSGDIYVIGQYCKKKATGSALVTVLQAEPAPTPAPLPTVGPSPRPTPTLAPTPTPLASKQVFITSTLYNGNLGGLSGADAKCQTQAIAANLSGTWKAWLSDNTTSATSRLSHSNLPYAMVNGTIIANNWTDLTDGTLASSLIIDENGSMHGNYVWTGTNEFGAINDPNISKCSDWTALSNDSPSGPAGHSGIPIINGPATD